MLPTVTPTTDLVLELVRAYRATARGLLRQADVEPSSNHRLLLDLANEWVSLSNLVHLTNDETLIDAPGTVMADVYSAAEHLESARHGDLDQRTHHLDAARTYIRLVRTSPGMG